MIPEWIERAASTLVALRMHESRNGAATALPDACRPDNLGDAYTIQEQVRRMHAQGAGQAVVGWKIGCTTPVMQDYLGIAHPCAGTLYSGTLFSEAATLSASRHLKLGLECEIAVRLGRPLGATPSHDEMRNAIDAVMTSVEIVEHRFADFAAAGTPSLIADDFFSVGAVIGRPNSPDNLADLATLEGGFCINGEAPADSGRGDSILGHPLNALAWLAEHAHARGTPLREGTIVTLGSVVKTIYPSVGDEVTADFPALGSVHLSIVE